MFLEYGLDSHGSMIHIDYAARGLGDLVCPYCSGRLIARKGSEKIHHFAHAGETCRQVADRDNSAFHLPYYDKFDLGLSPSQIKTLESLHNKPGDYDDRLFKRGFIKEAYNPRGWFTEYEPTHKGKIPFGATTLATFAQIQMEKMLNRHQETIQIIEKLKNGVEESNQTIKRYRERLDYVPYGESDQASKERESRNEWMHEVIAKQQEYILKNEAEISAALTDLNIYRAQLRRVFSCSLYFLEIKHSGGVLYKIGVTNRSIEERIEEIKRDLAGHLTGVQITVLRQLAHRGAVEFYFKHRYKANQQRIGTLTEYLRFDDRKQVLSDLSKLGDYEPDDFMLAILRGEPSQIEREIEAEKERIIREAAEQQRREAHRANTKAGMQAAAEQGVHIGRPKDEGAAILAKYPEIVVLLQEGKAVKTIARETGIAKNTVKKVRSAMENISVSANPAPEQE